MLRNCPRVTQTFLMTAFPSLEFQNVPFWYFCQLPLWAIDGDIGFSRLGHFPVQAHTAQHAMRCTWIGEWANLKNSFLIYDPRRYQNKLVHCIISICFCKTIATHWLWSALMDIKMFVTLLDKIRLPMHTIVHTRMFPSVHFLKPTVMTWRQHIKVRSWGAVEWMHKK